MTIDMNAFMSDTEHRSCWKYGIEILGTGLPSNDKDAIMFDKETGELEIYSIQPLSEGDYHVRLEVVDRETEEVKDAHQIKLDFLPPVKPLPEPDTDEDENEADNDEDQEEESDNEELDEEEQEEEKTCEKYAEIEKQIRELQSLAADIKETIESCPANDNNDDEDGDEHDEDDSTPDEDEEEKDNEQSEYHEIGPNGEEFYGTATKEQLNNIRIHDGSMEQNSKLRFGNQASGPMWINYIAKDKLWPQTLKLPSGMVVDYEVPAGQLVEATRFWPKYDCDEKGQNCVFGESGGPDIPCPPQGCAPPIDSKFEATFGASDGNDWYNSSHVDGWTLPYFANFNCEGDASNTAALNCLGLK